MPGGTFLAAALATALWTGTAGDLVLTSGLPPTEGSATTASFDIPPQRLGAALSQFAQASGIDILFDHRVIGTRRSSPVKGEMTPRDALDTMLAGTGLKARFMGSRSAIIMPAAAAGGDTASAAGTGGLSTRGAVASLVLDEARVKHAPLIGRPAKDSSAFREYGRRAQSVLEQAIRDSRIGERTDLTVRMSMMVDHAGHVSRLMLDHGSGSARLDAELHGILSDGIRLDPPPATLPQPLAFEIRIKRP